jgi:acyl-CoA reductase-like NAD-dependent aldehyde dehydrogenase
MTVPQTRVDWQRLAAELRYETGHFIDGQPVAAGGRRFAVVNPATAETLCEVAAASGRDAVVASGRRAFAGSWRRMARSPRR